MRKSIRCLWSRRLGLLTVILCLPALAFAGPTKNVLIVRGQSPELTGGRIVVDAVEATIRASVASPVEFFVESLDTARFSGEQYERRLSDLLTEKYATRHMDLVVALSEPAVEFVLRERALFPATPLLVGLIERRVIPADRLPRDAGVVYVELAPRQTLELAQQTMPGARRALVIGGAARFDREWMRLVREDLGVLHGRMAIDYDTESSIDALQIKVRALQADTVVLYASMTRDGAGVPVQPADALERLRAVSPVPIFGLATTYLGHGIVGGHLLDFERHGADLGRQAVHMLAGEHPAAVTTATREAVDWREMQRYGIAESSLPAAAAIMFRTPGLWERQRNTILSTSLVMAIETALILALVRNGYRRREIQRRLENRLRFERLLSEVSVSLAATAPEDIDAVIDASLSNIATALRIRWVWRWMGGDPEDAAWRSPRLAGGEPEWFTDADALPPTIQRRLRECAAIPCPVLAVPLLAGDVSAGALFGAFADPPATWGERGGELRVLAAVVATVLHRKRLSVAFEASDRLKGAILDSLPAHVAVVDREGTIIAVNAAWSSPTQRHPLASGALVERGNNLLDLFGTNHDMSITGSRDAIIVIEHACRGEQTRRQVEFRCGSGSTERWFLMTAEPLRRGEGGAVVTHWDITERKQNELALRESEDRFRRMSDALPVSVWMTDGDGDCTYLNKQFLQFTGRSFEENRGEGWLDSIHPEDRSTCMDLYVRAFHSRERFRMEYRIRRHDGVYRWLLAVGTPRYGSDGAFHGFVGGWFDITEQKDAERLLRDLSHRLMRAQDEERRRIARELHDHLSQQLALLAVDLQQLSIRPVPPQEAAATLQEAWRRTTEIASDVHAISHKLHPSKMEALGLVATAQGHCRDLSRQSIPIHFSHADMPPGVPSDRSLSLFRILEEALSNVLRHSGATEARVTLYGTDSHIVLRVADNGRGFVETGRQPAGLGLVSMRERLQLLEGTLAITSVPAKGTVLEARIPRSREPVGAVPARDANGEPGTVRASRAGSA